MEIQTRKAAAAWLSVASNVTLMAFKIVVGAITGSVSVISESIHSGVDLLASIIALVAVKGGAKPADQEHPFGHGKYENLSGVVEAVLVFAAGAWIVYEAVGKILAPRPISTPSWGVLVMLISAAANWGVSRFLFRVARETDSVALQADGRHLRTDVYTSVGVTLGLALISLGDTLLPKLGITAQRLDVLHLIDPAAAIVVAALIVRTACKMAVQAGRGLMDMSLPAEEAWVRQLLQTFVPRVHGSHRMRTRKAGSTIFIEFHIFVDGGMTVEDSHRLAHEIGRKIKEHYPDCSVLVHVEPCSGQCDRCYRSGCLLTEAEQQAVRDARSRRDGTGP